jgi:hypothetical protein
MYALKAIMAMHPVSRRESAAGNVMLVFIAKRRVQLQNNMHVVMLLYSVPKVLQLQFQYLKAIIQFFL